jgi:leucyl aminopeptidase
MIRFEVIDGFVGHVSILSNVWFIMVNMTKLKNAISENFPSASSAIAYVIGVKPDGAKSTLAKSGLEHKFLASINLDSLGVSSGLGKTTKISGPNSSLVFLIGLGSSQDIDSLRFVGGVAARELGDAEHVVIDIPSKSSAETLALFEGFLLGNYDFQNYKSKPVKRRLARLTIVSKSKPKATELAEIETIVSAVHACRDLVNQPANDLYPEVMTQQAKKASKGLPIKIKVWEEKDLLAQGLGGIHAVGKGSSKPPRLVKLEYKPAGAKTSMALVGKGITFDTGGLSLKPAESMVGMKYDMTGAAAVMQALVAIASLGIKVKATAWLCLAENMPSGSATRPNDIIKIRNGKTVEVLNTDAEGRLVLADGLSMAVEESPDYLIDVATLTGAATIALGNRYAGLMGDEAAIKKVEKASESVGELVWHMPLPEELRPLLDSDIADIANVKIGNRAGGMLIGGLFLREFVGADQAKKPAWAHLDIAGPANNDSAAYGHTPKGATGVTVRTLIQLARDLAN